MVLGSSTHFAFALATLTAALSGCFRAGQAQESKTVPELRLEGVHFRLFRGDALRAEGTASSLTYQRETTAVRAEQIALSLHERPGDVLLTAPEGQGVVSAKTFEATGGLVAVRGADTARTESARFEPGIGDRGQVVGDRPVELSGKGYRLRGNGFTLDPAVGQIALRGGTRLVAGLGGGR